MINAIGEATLQNTVRTNHNNELNDKMVKEQEAVQTREERPVENTEQTSESKMNFDDNTNTRTKHTIVEGKIVFERYNSEGKLILKVPPGYVPITEKA